MKIFPVTFDPRSKLCTILFASLALIFPLPPILEMGFILLLCFFFVVSGDWKLGFIFSAIFLFLWVTDRYFFPYVSHPIMVIFDFLAVGNRRLLPTIMAATFAMRRTKISEWLAAMQKLHLPSIVLVPLAVLFRFFPMALQELRYIRRAMKFRGIGTSLGYMLTHPLKSMEYLFVPLLLSAEETSMNLSATALVRGLSNPQKHTSVYQLKLQIMDYLLLASLVSCFALRMWVK